MPVAALIRRLGHYTHLSHADVDKLNALGGRERHFTRGSDIITAGQQLNELLVIEEGWSIRHKTLEDGRRQVLNVLLPGEIFDLQVMIGAKSDHGVSAVTDVRATVFAPQQISHLLAGSGTLSMALWWTQVQEEAFLREQIVRNGRQSARERIGHLLLELHRRAQIANMAGENGFRLPLTQTVIADILGLTPIHTNRVLRGFERDGLIERDRSYIAFKDHDRLAEICHFDPAYFHMEGIHRLSFGEAAMS